MRPLILLLLASVAAAPAFAQQPSPMTGTTSTAPVAPPAVATQPSATPSVTPAAPLAPAPRISHPRATMQQRFEAANTTHDGKLTLDQAKAANMVRIVNNYAAIDSTQKGYVTMEDLRAFNRAQRQAHRAAAAAAKKQAQ